MSQDTRCGQRLRKVLARADPGKRDDPALAPEGRQMVAPGESASPGIEEG